MNAKDKENEEVVKETAGFPPTEEEYEDAAGGVCVWEDGWCVTHDTDHSMSDEEDDDWDGESEE